jgi:hypothetical protein
MQPAAYRRARRRWYTRWAPRESRRVCSASGLSSAGFTVPIGCRCAVVSSTPAASAMGTFQAVIPEGHRSQSWRQHLDVRMDFESLQQAGSSWVVR